MIKSYIELEDDKACRNGARVSSYESKHVICVLLNVSEIIITYYFVHTVILFVGL